MICLAIFLCFSSFKFYILRTCVMENAKLRHCHRHTLNNVKNHVMLGDASMCNNNNLLATSLNSNFVTQQQQQQLHHMFNTINIISNIIDSYNSFIAFKYTMTIDRFTYKVFSEEKSVFLNVCSVLVFCTVLCVCFCTDHVVMVPLKMLCLYLSGQYCLHLTF